MSLRHETALLDRLGRDLEATGIVSQAVPALKLIYLCVASRVLDRPVSVVVKGQSSSGKSWPVEQLLKKFCPTSAYRVLTGITTKSLAYGDDKTEPLAHRMLVIGESAGIGGDGDQEGNLLLRTLLSEGYIAYTYTTGTDKNGKRGTETIHREGPTGLITTTTNFKLYHDDETRMMSVTIPDPKERRRNIRNEWSLQAAGKKGKKTQQDRETAKRQEEWRMLGAAIERGEHRVLIPFAETVDSLIDDMPARFSRDWISTLVLIQAHAILHREQRDRDEDGWIVATLDDYEQVRELIEPIVATAVQRDVPSSARAIYEALVNMGAGSGIDGRTITQKEIVAHVGLDKSTVSREVGWLKGEGYVRNLEWRQGVPHALVLGDPLPGLGRVFPTRREVEQGQREPDAEPEPPGDDGWLF